MRCVDGRLEPRRARFITGNLAGTRSALATRAMTPANAALAVLQEGPEEPVPQMSPAPAALRHLRERIRQATSDEVEARWKLLLQQLETLARLTARDLARSRAPDPATLRTEVDCLENQLREVSGGSVELFACRITCQELSRRAASSRRPRAGRAAALDAIERVRLDARALFEWAKSDLWTGVARRAVVEANRTALDLERESAATLSRVHRLLARAQAERGTGHELNQIAEDLALHELGRILTAGHCLRLPVKSDPLQEVGLSSARGVLSRLAPRLRSRSAA